MNFSWSYKRSLLVLVTLLLLLPIFYLFTIELIAYNRAKYHFRAEEGFSLLMAGSEWELTKGDVSGWPYKRFHYNAVQAGKSYPIYVTVDIFLSSVMWKDY